MEKQVYDRIIVNPKIMTGKPVIKGTRIPIDLIVELLAEGLTKEEIFSFVRDFYRYVNDSKNKFPEFKIKLN